MSKAEEQALKAYPREYDARFESNVDRRIGYKQGYNQAQQDYIVYAQLWVDSGEVNIKSFKQFLKDRGYE